MSNLKGAPELRKRLRAIGLTFKPVGQQWAEATADAARTKVPIRTGRLRGSFRRRNATMKKATVSGHFTAYFVDKGPKPHIIKAKRAKGLVFQGRMGTVFAKQVQHRGYRGRPFRDRAAREGLRKTPMAEILIKQWNQAA